MKKRIHDIPRILGTFFSRKPVVIILSVLCAIVIWFTIAVNVYPSTPVRFYNIPVKVDLSGTNAEANGLSVVECEVETVNVELTGDRSQVGNLTAEDLIAYADVGGISSSGSYSLSLDVRTDTGITFTVDTITPSKTNVRLDKIETHTFDVEASFPNLVVTSGHTFDMEDVVCEPSTIEITGPSAQLSEISKVVVYSDKSAEISSSYSLYSNELQLYTEEGALLDMDSFDIPSVDFQISIPILSQKTLELTYDLIGVPSSFTKADQDWLRERLTLSEDSITLASQTSSAFTDKDSLSVGYVRMSEIGLDYSATMDIALEDDYINQSGIQQVTLSLDNEGLTSRTFTVDTSNISIINAPTNYDFNLITKRLDVTVVGDEEALDALDADDIIVTVDLLNFDVDTYPSESFSWPSSLSFYQQSKMWAIGSYRIALERVDKPETTTEAATEAVRETTTTTTE